MSTRTTRRELEALARTLGTVMGYVPAPDGWSLPPGTLVRPVHEDDLAARTGATDVHAIALVIDHASCYGGYVLRECEIVTNHMGRIVPSGQYTPFPDERTSAGDFARALRMAIRVVEHLPRVRQA